MTPGRPEGGVLPFAGRRAAVAAAALGAALAFAALGAWQVERLGTKRALIARVEARVHAPPVPLPASAWDAAAAAGDAYRRVVLSGRFLDDTPALVQAVTVRGGGYWVVAPFRLESGGTVLVNRGFVPSEARAATLAAPRPTATEVTGLVRASEPGGAFLRSNDPGADRWFSRDVAAIAEARGLGHVAPVFVDAEAGPDEPGAPVGGLTVIAFPNNHLVYALTWFALAAMSLAYGLLAWRRRA